jgi:predicted nucleotidyltransferase
MPYGLRDRDLALIIESITTFPEIKEVVLFGSRAKGVQKTGSDVDLAIKGRGVTHETVVRLSAALNEDKPLPYFFDVVHYEGIKEPRLTEHIDRVGIVIYSRDAKQGSL